MPTIQPVLRTKRVLSLLWHSSPPCLTPPSQPRRVTSNVYGLSGSFYGVPPMENHDDGGHLTLQKDLFFQTFGALGLLRGVRGPFSDPNKPITTSWDAHMTDFWQFLSTFSMFDRMRGVRRLLVYRRVWKNRGRTSPL